MFGVLLHKLNEFFVIFERISVECKKMQALQFRAFKITNWSVSNRRRLLITFAVNAAPSKSLAGS